MKIYIVGSMAAFKDFNKTKKELEKLNFEPVLPLYVGELSRGEITQVHTNQRKKDNELIKENFRYVSSVDAVLVVNVEKNGIKNYVGANTLIEMAFAHVQNKPIFLLNDVPEIAYQDEIESMKPIVLNGDLTKIKGYLCQSILKIK
ncbi:MAG: hypothetical protein M1355_01705 [Patescibacteria group bacterium]|nr:hypothetical protein [Patescibacteria group bacterium]